MDPLFTHTFMAYKAETGKAKRWRKETAIKKGRQTLPNKDNNATVRQMVGKHTEKDNDRTEGAGKARREKIL